MAKKYFASGKNPVVKLKKKIIYLTKDTKL